MRFATRQELDSNIETFNTVADIIASDIVREARMKRRAAPSTLSALLDMDLGVEVGKMTPPVKIYQVGPDGELILKEQIQATTFRRRALESLGGKAFQAKLDDLQRKRKRAGQMSKAKSRAARVRLGTAVRHPLPLEDEEA